MDSGNLPDDFLLKDKDQNKASVLVPVLTLRELNISDPAALVVDHNSYVVLNTEGAHTSMATADFDLSAAILRSKKIEAPVLYRGIVHSFNSVNNLELKVLLASPSAYLANPKTKSLNAPMLIGSVIPLVTAVRARVTVRILISGSLSMFSDRFFGSEVQKAGNSTRHEKSGHKQFLFEYERLGYTSVSLTRQIPLRPLEMNSIPPPQNNLGWCIHAAIKSSSLEDHLSCKQHRHEEGTIVRPESYYCTWLENYKYVCFHFGGASTLQVIVDFLQMVASKKDQTQLWASSSTPYSLIPVAEFVEAIRQSRYGNSIKTNPISSPPITQPSSSPDFSLPTMKGYGGAASILGVMAIVLQMQSLLILAGCPLDLSGSNVTLVASVCSNHDDRGKCCRYINAFVAVSIGHYANATSNLGVDSDVSEVCLHSVLGTLELYGVPPNATADNCDVSLLEESDCKRCINASIMYLHHIIEAEDNVTLNTCRDATFVALASQADNVSAVEFASYFFGAPGLSTAVSRTSSSSTSPNNSPSSPVTASPSELSLSISNNESHHPYHLTLIPGVAIVVTTISVMLLLVLIFLIHRKGRELDNSHSLKPSKEPFPFLSGQTIPGGFPMFQKFNYKETKKATNNFSTIVGQGGFATVYKAQFTDDLVAAVKRMNKVPEQAEDEFCREIELLARLHHRHLATLKRFCFEKKERFLLYEYMENGSLKDYFHSLVITPLSWQMRIQIAIDVANALEYLHFYCDPPLCHSDIESINILLDENFVAKVADFGLAHASKEGSIYLEPINIDLTEKSNVYNYGVLLLELVSARQAIQDNKNLIEWSQLYIALESRLHELVDPRLDDSFNYDQLQTVMSIVRWCTQNEGRARPSIKQVLRLLYEILDPLHDGFVEAVL
ncbi:hypothetical protein Nepgr_027622 [Nepenthes gracilis]|uniref:Protein kinase domain-containing protein n=1 Tax=Nepenthes gracilis TaxID=150966 RepID=A0AAD3TAM7_NEPGR|nr:hypothetical protein Nepgr_027622 [Nepenthes gracilis]